MGPVNWLAVAVAAIVGAMVHVGWHGLLNPRQKSVGRAGLLVVMAMASVMLGHNYARLGAEKLASKPWLYWMQSGGLALAFVMPAVWLAGARGGKRGSVVVDCGFWLVAYLAMGTVFWALR